MKNNIQNTKNNVELFQIWIKTYINWTQLEMDTLLHFSEWLEFYSKPLDFHIDISNFDNHMSWSYIQDPS